MCSDLGSRFGGGAGAPGRSGDPDTGDLGLVWRGAHLAAQPTERGESFSSLLHEHTLLYCSIMRYITNMHDIVIVGASKYRELIIQNCECILRIPLPLTGHNAQPLYAACAL